MKISIGKSIENNNRREIKIKIIFKICYFDFDSRSDMLLGMACSLGDFDADGKSEGKALPDSMSSPDFSKEGSSEIGATPP